MWFIMFIIVSNFFDSEVFRSTYNTVRVQFKSRGRGPCGTGSLDVDQDQVRSREIPWVPLSEGETRSQKRKRSIPETESTTVPRETSVDWWRVSGLRSKVSLYTSVVWATQ